MFTRDQIREFLFEEPEDDDLPKHQVFYDGINIWMTHYNYSDEAQEKENLADPSFSIGIGQGEYKDFKLSAADLSKFSVYVRLRK